MARFLNNVFFNTQSAPSTPISGGVLYTSGSSVFFTNSNGDGYNLTGSKGYILVTEYTQSGGTWSTPSDVKYVKIVAVGGGGGGGGGARSTASIAAAGGGGGQGGDIAIIFYTSGSIPPGTYTITVGGGGNGGPGRTTTTGSGTGGAVGSDTSLASGSITLISASGGVGAGGGAINDTFIVGGLRSTTANLLNFLPFRMLGWGGGYVTNYQGVNPTYSSNAQTLDGNYHARGSIRGTGGGGGGSGITTTTALNGASGSAVWGINGILIQSGSPGVAGSSPANSGSDGASNLVSAACLFSFSGSSIVTSSYGFGGGGHGAGAGNTGQTVPGGKGGNGGYFGAGGGGGGAAWGQNGGSGGNGGGGYLAILEYY